MEESNEFVVRDELREKRRKIESIDDLAEFLKDIEENYDTGYGEAPRAIAQAALATAYYFSKVFGITGFQAGFVMWDFIRDWMYANNTCGLKIVDFDNMLYPQYEYKFVDKVISSDVWDSLQKEAKNNLDNYKDVNKRVIEHWQSIVDGNVPFGFTVEEL